MAPPDPTSVLRSPHSRAEQAGCGEYSRGAGDPGRWPWGWALDGALSSAFLSGLYREPEGPCPKMGENDNLMFLMNGKIGHRETTPPSCRVQRRSLCTPHKKITFPDSSKERELLPSPSGMVRREEGFSPRPGNSSANERLSRLSQ